MTIQQILDLPTTELAAMSDAQLEAALGALIPQSRAPDKARFQQREIAALQQQAAAYLAAVAAKTPSATATK